MPAFDYALVGGGLQNALLASALAHQAPDASIALIDPAEELGRGHTWCFHASDVEPRAHGWIEPFVETRWDGYDVAFPSYERTLCGGYYCVTGARLNRVVHRLFESSPRRRLFLGTSAAKVTDRTVLLPNGEELHAEVIVDARGPERLRGTPIAGYQKFLGLELDLTKPHPRSRPMLMDARVAQLDGFRFMYVLPFARRALLEDTYFSDTPDLDQDELRNRILQYAIEHGFSIANIVREELGILPLPASLPSPPTHAPLLGGYGGGWFHPTTGYSFPVAARLASYVAERAPRSLFDEDFDQLVSQHMRQVRFTTLLNRMLFEGFENENRRNVFERFYSLPEPTISRFYALSMTSLDRARIICGRPPRGMSIRRLVRRGNHP